MADATPNPPSPAIPDSVVARTVDHRGRGSGNGDKGPPPGFPLWRKFRNVLSRASLMSAFRTLLWAAPLTVLIWIYAERDGEHVITGYSLTIGLNRNDPRRVLHLESPPDGRVRVDLKGPLALVEDVEKRLNGASESLVRIDVDPNLTAGFHSIPVADITNNPLFVQHGISVYNFEPADITVDVDPIKTMDLEVKAPPSANLASPPAFEPRVVHVRIPQSLFAGDAHYGAFAQLDNFPDIKTPGTHDLTNVPVAVYRLTPSGPSPTPITDPNVTILPGFVNAKIEVKNADEAYTIPVVPVWPTIDTDMMDKFKPILGDPAQSGVLHNVKVVGPPAQIELLKSGNFRPIASFEVDASKQQTSTPYTASIHIGGLPEGVHVSPDDQNRNINYQLVDRASGG